MHHLELRTSCSIVDLKVKNKKMRMCGKIKMAGNSNLVPKQLVS